jgi:hypothetical protein
MEKIKINVLTILLITLAYLLTNSSTFAQSPQLMSYQAVIRDAGNNLVTNHSVGMRVSIMQGSPTGTIVYQEIYNPDPQTNADGLVTVEIGSGLVITGIFANINWSNGPYYIKTETDPTGATTYSITGTSQLLSVPYALHSQVADTAKYSTMASIKAGTNVIVTGSGTAANPYVINDSVHKIGDSYGGGIVFYVYDNGRHGLIAATTDQNTGLVGWTTATYTNTVSNAARDGIKGGQDNTERIIIQAGAGTYAAQLCANYNGGNFGDWYLPSKYELNLLYLQQNIVGGFASNFYWCSTEQGATYAYVQMFSTGSQNYTNKTSSGGCYVRAIRAF